MASRQLLRQGQEELAAGDVRQASEKGWGAAAQMVKSTAERRAWQHRNHAALFTAVSRLVNETGDEDVSLLFAVANSLYVNFYENWEKADNVGRHLAAVERLLDKLERLLWDESSNYLETGNNTMRPLRRGHVAGVRPATPCNTLMVSALRIYRDDS